MDLRFCAPQLAKLDELSEEVLACAVFSDERPCHGVAGLCDFRMSGRISSLTRRAFVTGALGEVVMLPGRPLLSFEKVILFGGGERGRFDEATYTVVLRRMLRTMEGLAARTAVVELPGRHARLISAIDAADILLREASALEEHETWVLVEGAEGKSAISQHMIEQKRRVRREP